jgi:hypothetical protein
MNKNASIEGYARPVINLNSNVLYVDGDGTIDNPYKVVFETTKKSTETK